MINTVYRRILLKISGESLGGKLNRHFLDKDILDHIARDIKQLVKYNVQIGIVVGGGNLFRGINLSKIGIDHITSDNMGMLATVINGLAIFDALYKIDIEANIMSAITINGICNNYNWLEAIKLMCKRIVVIFCAGTGNPLCTTDSAACLRGIEIKADILLKGTKVDGVYSDDPKYNLNAVMYKSISYSEVLKHKLRVMDFTALILAKEYHLPICVFNIYKSGALYRIITGQKEGTIIN